MDIATIIGITAGFALILSSIVLGGGMSGFINVQAMMVTIGGTIAATLITYPLSQVFGMLQVVKNAFLFKTHSTAEIINILVSFSQKARREGILSLEQEASEIDNAFLQNGIELAVDGTEPELIREILTTDLDKIETRHDYGQGIFVTMGTYAPAFGMIGTLIGLVQMLRTMDDPSTIGPGMAVALLTTFYGCIMANLLFLPIAGKLKSRSEEELLLKELMIEGILSIQSGDNPRIVEQRLKSFLAPGRRDFEISQSEKT
jgi:chemotaxis protein MotA